MLNVVGISHLVGLIGVSALIPFFDSEFSASALGFGVLAGGFSGAGVMLLYRGLARGPMAVIAPLTAITSAAVATIWGVASGDSVSGVAWIGIAVALVAIGMVSIPNEMGAAPITGQAIGEALVSGACFGAMFIAFDAAPDTSAPWPVVGARIFTVTLLLGFIALKARDGLATVLPALGAIVLAGLLDTGSNLLFLIATQQGGLTITAVLSSLYPAFTVLLARFALDERMSRLQLGGLTAALIATALIALG